MISKCNLSVLFVLDVVTTPKNESRLMKYEERLNSWLNSLHQTPA